MSGNIHDTNTHKLKLDVHLLLQDIQDITSHGGNPLDHKNRLESKYNYLSTTSKTLFKFILTSANTNPDFFQKTLDMMLQKIQQIQSSKTTQFDASRDIGTHLAKTFIPQCKDIE